MPYRSATLSPVCKTGRILEQLDEWVLQRDPDIVHVNTGLHDMVRDVGPGPETRVSLEEYRDNLPKIFSTLREKTRAKVIFALTTPVDLERQLAYGKGVNRINEDVVEYNKVAREVVREFDVALNDLYQVVVDRGVGTMLSEDGVHFTEDASVILGRVVAEAIRAAAVNP